MKVSQAGKRRAHTTRALTRIRFKVMFDQCVFDGMTRALNRMADAYRTMTAALNEGSSAMKRDLARLQGGPSGADERNA